MERSLSRSLIALMATVALNGHAVDLDVAPLDFRVEVVPQCSVVSTRESGAGVAALFGQALVEATVGFATTMLEQAAADQSIAFTSSAPTAMLRQVGKNLEFNPQCVRFWRGRTASAPLGAGVSLPNTDELDLKGESRLVATWKSLGLVEVPYLYAEIEVVPNASATAVYLEPRLFFYRPNRDEMSWLRHSPSLALGVDFLGIGGGTPLSTAIFSFGEEVAQPVLMRADALKGKLSGWMAIPARPEKNDGAATVGDVTVKVTLTQTQKGSAFVKAVADAVKAKKGDITTAAVAALPWKRKEAEEAARIATETAMVAIFDAELDVQKATADLAAADPAKKIEFEIKLKKAQFEADRKRRQAGLPPKYNVAL